VVFSGVMFMSHISKSRDVIRQDRADEHKMIKIGTFSEILTIKVHT
jgi:hypothetical protein